MKIVLRPATISDLSILKYWDSHPHVLKAKNLTEPDTDWDWEAELNRHPPWRELLIGEVDRRPVGFIQTIDPKEEESHYWGDVPPNLRAIDIWIGDEKDLGKGYGTAMMQMALDRCFKDESVQHVLIDPLENNKKVHPFYERLGFKFVEQRTFGGDRCLVYQLSRSGWTAGAERHPKVECSGGILVKEGKYLFGKRSPVAAWYPEVWDVFGGHAEHGETPSDTLIRELQEELDIVPIRYQLSGVLEYFEGSVQKKIQYNNYFITEWLGNIQNRGAEHTEIRWFDRSALELVPLAAKEYLDLIDAWVPVQNNSYGQCR